ncbi:hypothetical protein MASR1M74_03160 [Lentimicrobium sp.]
MGIRLSDHGVEADVIDRIIERFADALGMTTVGNPKDINVEEVRTILEDVM